jgi:gamma-glutamyl phosphate reductase
MRYAEFYAELGVIILRTKKFLLNQNALKALKKLKNSIGHINKHISEHTQYIIWEKINAILHIYFFPNNVL